MEVKRWQGYRTVLGGQQKAGRRGAGQEIRREGSRGNHKQQEVRTMVGRE